MMNREIICLHEAPDNAYGYVVDLSTVELNETDTSSWIMAAPHGKWDHPIYGELDFTPERTKRFADNVKSNVRGQDLDIDYDHKIQTGEAAGWVKDAESRPDGLWLLIDWTKEAFGKIKSKAYRYFSPEFVSEWEHPQTGQKYQDVLFGGGITNRPFLKGILPMNLSELADSTPNKEDEMDRKRLERLAKSLGVEFTAETSDEDLQSLVDAAPDPEPPEPEPDPVVEEVETEDGPTELDAKELGVQLSELKANPALIRLLAERKQDRKRLAALEVSNKLAETDRRIGEIGTDKHVLSPKAKKALRGIAVKLSEDDSKVLFDAIKVIFDDGIVVLGEQGRTREHIDTTETDKFEGAVKKLMEGEKEMSYADAVERVALTEPDLFEAYRLEATAGTEN